MGIIGLQRRLVEVGRIRMGERNEKGHPTRLDTWKLTSRDQLRLQAAARVYGGEVQEWDGHAGQYELHTTTDALPILLMPGQALSQHYELWSGGGCKRRCDGETEQLTDGACLCDPEQRECKPHTRLNVLLPDVPGIGCWRLDTTGYYAATELTGTVDLLEIATMRGVLLPARLRIDQRAVLRDGQTKRFPVPTLDIDVRPLEMHAITQAASEGEVAQVPSGYTPLPALPAGTSVKDGLAAAAARVEPQTRTARSAAPIGDGEDFGGDIPVPVPDGDQQMLPAEDKMDTPEANAVPRTQGREQSSPIEGEAFSPGDGLLIASAEQQKLIMARAREFGWSDAARYDLTENICGSDIRSVKKVPKDKVDTLLAALERGQLAEQTIEELTGRLRDYGNALDIIQQVDAAVTQHADDRDWLERQLARLKQRYEEAQGAA